MPFSPLCCSSVEVANPMAPARTASSTSRRISAISGAVAARLVASAPSTYVLGADATKRAATAPEIAEMRRLVLEAVRAGAIGFATSTLEQHNGENGVPMPSRLADEGEMLALTGALGEAG